MEGSGMILERPGRVLEDSRMEMEESDDLRG